MIKEPVSFYPRLKIYVVTLYGRDEVEVEADSAYPVDGDLVLEFEEKKVATFARQTWLCAQPKKGEPIVMSRDYAETT